MPKARAPERLSFQTGIICSFFGVTHPLCKWVDEIIPKVPWGAVKGDIGKTIAKNIRRDISSKAISNLTSVSNDLEFIKFIKNTIDTTNQLIDDIIDTMQGGEVSTLEFCLAGKPPVPEDINWGDVFLAFSGIYPDSLIEKMSKAFAYKAFFDHCRCASPGADRPPVKELPLTIPDFGLPFPEDTTDPCEQNINSFYRGANGINASTRNALTNRWIAFDLWNCDSPSASVLLVNAEMRYVDEVSPRYFSYGFFDEYYGPCCYVHYYKQAVCRRLCAGWGTVDWVSYSGVNSGTSVVILGPDVVEPNCDPYRPRLDNYYTRVANRESPCRYYDDNDQPAYDPNRAFEFGGDIIIPVYYVAKCNDVPREKSDDDLREIKPIDPVQNPCETDPDNPEYKELCQECPPCPPAAKITTIEITTSICDGEPRVITGSAYDGIVEEGNDDQVPDENGGGNDRGVGLP